VNGRASRARKAAFLLFLLLLLLAVGIAFWIRSVRDRKWDALVSQVEQLSAEIEPRAPGLDYVRIVPSRPTEVIADKVHAYLQGMTNASRADVQALPSMYAESIDLLSRCARRSEAPTPARMAHDWQDSNALLLARARLLVEAGKIPESLEVFLDACVHAGDVAQSGVSAAGFTGHKMLLVTFRELRHLLQTRDIALQDLSALDHRLQLLDEGFPGPGRDVELNLLDLGKMLISEDRDARTYHHIDGRLRPTWRSFFSSRLQAASTFFEADRLVQRVLQARTLSWSEENRVLRDLGSEMMDASDRLLVYSLPHSQVSRYAHQSKAALRLLRVAAHYRATGEVLELEDPFGGKMQFAESKGSLRAWRQLQYGEPALPQSSDYWTTAVIEVSRK